MIKKLMKGIEESEKEKERVSAETESLKATFKEIEQKAFMVQENYNKTQKVELDLTIFLFKSVYYIVTITVCHSCFSWTIKSYAINW